MSVVRNWLNWISVLPKKRWFMYGSMAFDYVSGNVQICLHRCHIKFFNLNYRIYYVKVQHVWENLSSKVDWSIAFSYGITLMSVACIYFQTFVCFHIYLFIYLLIYLLSYFWTTEYNYILIFVAIHVIFYDIFHLDICVYI